MFVALSKGACDMFVTQSYDSSHDAPHALVYQTANYEDNHSEANADQAKAEGTIGNSVIPRINPKLFCERKELGICR